MDKPNTVSNKAKAALYFQEGALVDVIDFLLTEDEWQDYFHSIVPELNPYQTEPQDYENAALNLMEVFRDSVFLGVVPPTVILVYFAQYFDRYLRDSGTLSLDEAFKLKGKNKIGHPLKIQKNNQRDAAIYAGIAVLRKLKPLSVESAVGEIIDLWNIEVNEEVLKKKYLKHRKEAEILGRGIEWKKGDIDPELKEVLELFLENLFTIYTSGNSPKIRIADRERGIQRLKEHTISCIEQLGVSVEQMGMK